MLIEWSGDKLTNSQRCYEFLFDEFKRFYLSYMFPQAFMLNSQTNIPNSTSASITSSFTAQHSQALNVYSSADLIALLNDQAMPTFERPILASIGNMTSNDERKLTQLHCKEEIIKWLIGVLLMDPSSTSSSQSTNTGSASTSGIGSSVQGDSFSISSSSTIGTLIGSMDFNSLSLNNMGESGTLKANQQQDDLFSSDYDSQSSHYDQVSMSISSMSINTSTTSISTLTNANSVQQQNINKQLLQRVILASITNVNLVHEILRNVSC